MARKRIGEILIEAGVIDTPALRAALLEQKRWGGHLGRILVEMRLVEEDVLVDALSRQLNFPTVDLDAIDVGAEVLALIPGDLAEHHSIMPFARAGKFLDVAMSDPTNLGIIDELRIRTQLNVRSYLAGPTKIERAIARYYNRGFSSIGLVLDPRDARAQTDGDFADEQESFDIDVNGGLEIHEPRTAARAGAIRKARADARAEAKPPAERDAEILALQERISRLEALISRDEDVLRKVLGLLVDKGLATREEILERLK